VTDLSARKIPQLRTLFLLSLLSAHPALATQQDSLRLYGAARTAEAQYEHSARALAPWSFGAPQPGSCDEYVGRFCLYYDTGRDPLPAEPPRIAQARQQALAKIRAAFRSNPARIESVFPFIRLLLEDKQTAEASAVAAEFGAVTSDVATARMLAVLSHHASADIPAGERAVDDWLSAVDSTQRRRLTDISWLLASRERRRYRELSHSERAAYESVFWRFADALYLTEGNETRTEHFARHAEGKLIAAAPVVRGSTSWGNDVAELTVRFGTPKARTRERPVGIGSSDIRVIEHWDPEQLIYTPPALDSALQLRARPAHGWPLDTIRSISGHAPSTIRRMLPLEHQANVFRNTDGSYLIRVDGRVIADSAGRGKTSSRIGLFVLDGTLTEISRSLNEGTVRGDTLFFAAQAVLREAASHYSAELLEPQSKLAARARFRFERPQSDRGLELSDIMIAHPFLGGTPTNREDPRLLPRPDLLLGAGQAIGVYAEITDGLQTADSIRVDLELLAIDGRPALLKAARWVGKKLGLGEDAPPNRLSWLAEIDPTVPTPIAITVDAGRLKAGRYVVELTVVDIQPGVRRTTARREIVVEER
jgi:hypothetical protein